MQDPVLFLQALGHKFAAKRKEAVAFAGYTAGNVMKANQLAEEVEILTDDKAYLKEVLRDTAAYLAHMADLV